jgi:hypothetical protein
MQCSRIGSKCKSILSRTLGLPTVSKELLPKITFVGNSARLYGDVIATLPKAFFFDLDYGAPPSAFVPGIEPLLVSVTLHDDRDNTVKGSNFICRSRVCVYPHTACGDEDSIVTPGFHSMDGASRFQIQLAQVPCSLRSSSVILQISLVLYDEVLLSTSSIQCLPCARGQSRVEDKSKGVWQCVACAANQYILDPNNPAYTCQDCPAGATCDGNSLTGKVKGSVWTPNNATGRYLLEACPFGYEMFGAGSVSNALTELYQQCSNCSAKHYILNSSYRCQQCPVGAICDGVALRGLVAGSVWVPDYISGRYLLTSCPPGYQMDSAGSTNLALQRCSLCLAGSYCIGGAASSTLCPSGTFSAPGSNASAACIVATFVQLVVMLPCTKAFFESKQAEFVLCVASMVRVSTDEVVLDQVVPTTYRRAGNSDLAVQVQSRVAVWNQTAAAAVLSSATEANLNYELLSRGLPPANILSTTVLTNGGNSDTRNQLILTFCLIIGCLLLMGAAVVYYFARSKRKSDDEKELDATVASLRARLKINKADGFVLNTERISPLADTKFMVFINKTYVEAAARIALSDDFNIRHFDALCNCLECDVQEETGGDRKGGSQYEALCDWILEVCKDLIDPDLEGPKRKPARERFAYFEEVCAAQIWKSRDGQLFERLKSVAGGFMGQIARMCDERFGRICREEGGSELVGLQSWPGADQEEIAAGSGPYPEYFNASTPATLRRHVDQM